MGFWGFGEQSSVDAFESNLSNFHPRRAYNSFPVSKMAIDAYADQAVHDPSIEKKYGQGDAPPIFDAEKGKPRRFESGDGRVGARIAPVLPHLSGYDFGDDDSGSDILGKQIEMEAGNALQYRTCSWQKVATPRLAKVRLPLNIES